ENSALPSTASQVTSNNVQGATGPRGGTVGGGGIDTLNGDLTLNRVSVVGNQAFGGPSSTGGRFGPAGGGGLYLVHVDTTARGATLTNSVVADNSVQYSAGNGTLPGGGGRGI